MTNKAREQQNYQHLIADIQMVYLFSPHKPKLGCWDFFAVVVVKRVHVKQPERKSRGSICRTDGTCRGFLTHPSIHREPRDLIGKECRE